MTGGSQDSTNQQIKNMNSRSSIAKGHHIRMRMDYHEDPVIWNVNSVNAWKKNDIVHIQKLILTQPTEWTQEQLDDADDNGPILRAKEQGNQHEWVDISDQSRELKILWAHWDSLHIDQGILYCVWESKNGQNEHL